MKTLPFSPIDGPRLVVVAAKVDDDDSSFRPVRWGLIEIDATIYKRILAVLLVFAILKMLNVFGKENNHIKVNK